MEDLEALLEAKSPYYLGFGHAHLDLFWHPLPPDAPREKEKCHNWHKGKNVQKWPKFMFPEWISLRDVQVAGRAGPPPTIFVLKENVALRATIIVFR